MTHFRIERMNHLLQREISEILRREVKDPKTEGAVVTTVRTAKDLHSAFVLVSVIGDEKRREEAVEAINRAAGFIRHQLRDRMDVKVVPTLQFEVDRNVDYSFEIQGIIQHLHEEEGNGPEGG
jgi:ribosome-binding factor A